MAKGKCLLCGKPLSAGHIYQRGAYCNPCIERAVEKLTQAKASRPRG